MPLTDPQRAVIKCNKRFRVLISGRRFGKTFLAIQEMAKFAREVKDYFPKDPELALEHFQRSYSRLIALLIVSMTWNYLEAEKMVT